MVRRIRPETEILMPRMVKEVVPMEAEGVMKQTREPDCYLLDVMDT